MKTGIDKSNAPARAVRLGEARHLTKASFTGIATELVSPHRLYTPGG